MACWLAGLLAWAASLVAHKLAPAATNRSGACVTDGQAAAQPCCLQAPIRIGGAAVRLQASTKKRANFEQGPAKTAFFAHPPSRPSPSKDSSATQARRPGQRFSAWPGRPFQAAERGRRPGQVAASRRGVSLVGQQGRSGARWRAGCGCWRAARPCLAQRLAGRLSGPLRFLRFHPPLITPPSRHPAIPSPITPSPRRPVARRLSTHTLLSPPCAAGPLPPLAHAGGIIQFL